MSKDVRDYLRARGWVPGLSRMNAYGEIDNSGPPRGEISDWDPPAPLETARQPEVADWLMVGCIVLGVFAILFAVGAGIYALVGAATKPTRTEISCPPGMTLVFTDQGRHGPTGPMVCVEATTPTYTEVPR